MLYSRTLLFIYPIFTSLPLLPILPSPAPARSILEPLLERRASSGARVEDLSLKEDSENRMSKFKRKDWSLSKSQVIAEKASEPDLMVKTNKQTNTIDLPVCHCFPWSQAFHHLLHSCESPDGSLAWFLRTQQPAVGSDLRWC